MPKLYIDEFVGISNRLEVLPLAFAIRKAYGHDIILDWHELDSFSVADTRRGKVRLLARLGALRVRDCDQALFDTLGGRKIILRSLDGPADRLDPIYLETAARLKLAPTLAASIRRAFDRYRGRPVIGVHIRQGDYELVDGERYEISREWPAVPVWWYERLMTRIVARQPDACFFLSCTGDPAAFRELFERFEVFSLDLRSPYAYKGPDHRSSVNPVADLFALACCRMLLATPISGYSHWAANALGPASTCLVPLPGATREAPLAGVIRLHGQRLPRWRAAGRTGADTEPADASLTGIDLSREADTSWL
ncbi:MAG TPA: hypothetical protein VMV91_03860 [Rhodocyclaceae bacterium]|nr:hypothetical protein [Rhodocyclaceae bacterium]